MHSLSPWPGSQACRFVVVSLFCLSLHGSRADEFRDQLPKIPPQSPGESMTKIRLRDGFNVELVAAEPLVHDPVAVDFDEDGQMYVVELPPYNSYGVEDFHVKGSIRLLSDKDSDGVYESSTVFADGLSYPTAVACWDGGVFVGDAPDLLYLKDTDGDGKADERRIILTGFGTDKAGEAHLNSIRWGFDNRFHFSTNLSGGDVRAVDGAQADAASVSTRNRGVILDPRNTTNFELTSGAGQHGMSMDNWGRKFVCQNSIPAQTLMYDDRYAARNPYLEAPPVAIDIAPEGKFTKLFRISENEPWRVLRTHLRKTGKFRGSDEGGTPFGFFTGATGITIYRGDAWPAEYRGNLFVGDVANNLVYRARLEDNGLQLVAIRADEGAEFLASRDIWFRPVQFANAPDGSLYVLDMCRELIEGVAFLPPEFMKHLNPVGGHDLGRIYRIVHDSTVRRTVPKLGKATSAELVALLDHANGWHRDTASRLLYQRQDRSVVKLLRKLVEDGHSPEGRMTALHSLAGLERLDEATLLTALHDASSHVRIQALRIAERQLHEAPALQAAVVGLTDDDELSVRYQAAFSLGAVQSRSQPRALAQLAKRDGADKWMQLAVLSSSADSAGELFRRLAGDAEVRANGALSSMLISLAQQIGAAARSDDLAAVLKTIAAVPESEASFRENIVKAVVGKLPEKARSGFLTASSGDAAEVLRTLLNEARSVAVDEERSEADRADAVRSLSLSDFESVKPLLLELLSLQHPPGVRAAAIAALGETDDASASAAIINVWPELSPGLRSQATEVLLSRPEWIPLFLAAVERKQIGPRDMDPSRVALLKQHPDPEIRNRVNKVFAGTDLPRRTEVIERYQSVLDLTGNVERGRVVFRKNCTACHQLEGKGSVVGAELRGIRERGLPSIMLNILDPNREVKPRFNSYVLATADGRIYSGMISSENANSVTLRRPDGTVITLQRSEIEQLQSSGLSFMPEGLEKEIDQQAMADLLAYLNAVAE